jgi:hypothetical protein
MSFTLHSHQEMSVGRNSKILYSMCSPPIIDELASDVPLTKVLFLIEASRDECLSIWSPDNTADWLAETWEPHFDVSSLKIEVNITTPNMIELTYECVP